MLRYTVLIRIALLSSSLMIGDAVSCPVHLVPNNKTQILCNDIFTKLKRNCVDERYVISKIYKMSLFRGQVVCDFLSGPRFRQSMEEANIPLKFDAAQFIRTDLALKTTVDRDIKMKLDELAADEVAEEIENIARESETKIMEIESWLDKKEQSYLLKLKNLIQTVLGKEPTLSPAPAIPATTTYQPLPSREASPVNYWFPFTSITPFYRVIGTEEYDDADQINWMCISVGVSDWQRERSYGLALRKPYLMQIWNKIEDYNRFKVHIDNGDNFVLTIRFGLCHDHARRWAVYTKVF